MKARKKILICRTDKMGDLLLSLPAISYLRQHLPDSEIALLSRSSYGSLLSCFLKEHRIRSVQLEQPWWEENWDVFLSLHSDWKIALRAFYKKIPLRVGLGSKPWSLVFFNVPIRQRRSTAEKSEGLYSIELAHAVLEKLGEKKAIELFPLTLPENKVASEEARTYLESLGLNDGAPFVVLHPGMAGSALNISVETYSEIIIELQKKIKVLVSVGPLPEDKKIVKEMDLQGLKFLKAEGLSLPVLQEIFRKSRAVIAPSTGPLHLAHLVGVPTIGIYSPVRSHHPRRWAPWGGLITPKILYPEVPCPAKTECLGSSCHLFNCMKKLDWPTLILQAVDGLKVTT